MKIKAILSLIALAFLFVSCADETTNTKDTITQAELQQAARTLNKSLLHPDAAALKALSSSTLTYGHSSGKLENQEEFIDALVNGPFKFLDIEALDESFYLNGDTGLARHVLVAKGQNGADTVDLKLGILLVFQKHDGAISLIGRQAYKLP